MSLTGSLLVLSLIFRLAACSLHSVYPTHTGGLRAALLAANPGDEIVLHGLFFGENSCNLTVNTDNLTIRGLDGPGGAALIDCNHTSRHMTITGGRVVIRALHFIRGQDVEDGGCLRVQGSWLIVANTWFTDCTAGGDGGAVSVHAETGKTTLQSVQIVNSTAANARGGGMWLLNSSAELHDSLLTGNRAWGEGGGEGGGIFLAQSSLALFGNTLLEGNMAEQLGGAVSVSASSLLTVSCCVVFRGNSALLGGGAISKSDMTGSLSSVRVSTEEAVFENNQAGRGGAMLFFGVCEVTLGAGTHFLNNYAIYRGGGLYVDSDVYWEANRVPSRASDSDWKTKKIQQQEAQLNFGPGPVAFQGNRAGLDGGAIATYCPQISWNSSSEVSFLGNSAGYSGGAIVIWSPGPALINIEGGMFHENQAGFGGAIMLLLT